MKRPSPRVREQAALLCQMAASNDWIVGVTQDGSIDETNTGLMQFTDDPKAAWLAHLAWEATEPARRSYGYRLEEWWAEAEALLRTGWEP